MAVLLIAALPIMAQRAANALTEEDYYYAYFPETLASFDEENSGGELAYYYAIQDLDGDGAKEFVLADINKLKCVFKVVDGEVHLISPNYIISNGMWFQTSSPLLLATAAKMSPCATIRCLPTTSTSPTTASPCLAM